MPKPNILYYTMNYFDQFTRRTLTLESVDVIYYF